MKKLLALLLAAVMMMGVVSAVAEAPIKLAVIGPMTKAAAVYGQAVAHGAQIAADEINAAAGYTVVELLILDDEHNAQVSLSAYNTAKDAEVQAVVGTVTTAPCEEVSARAFEDRMFMLTPSASGTSVTEDKDNCYQLCFTDPSQGVMSANYIVENNLGSTIGVIYNNGDSYSTGIYQAFEDELEKLGVKIASVQAFNDSTTDFSVQVAAMKNAGCDLVFLPIYYTPASQILINAKSTDYAPVFFGVDGMDGILSLDGFDTSLAEDVMLLTPFWADSPDELTSNFVSKFVAEHKEVPNQFAADAYDCVYAMLAAMEIAGVNGETAFADACDPLIEVFSGDFTFTGVTGTMTWDESGAVNKLPIVVVIKNGTYVEPTV